MMIIDDAVLADFVVERGSSGSWTWEKWNSGYCEMRYIAQITVSPTTINGGIYRSAQVTMNLPFDLPIRHFASANFGDSWCWAQVAWFTTTQVCYAVFRGSPYSNIKNYIMIELKGKYK